MRIASLVFVTACWSASENPPVQPIAPVETPSYSGPIVRARPLFPLHSAWEGTYVCSQGLSSVRMTIDAQRDGAVTARYDFGATSSNPAVPNGAYTMKGKIQASAHGFSVDLEPDEWIDHPTGYVMVALSLGADGNEMTGTIHHASCNSFQARRIN